MTPNEMTTLQRYFDNALRAQSESNQKEHEMILAAVKRISDSGDERSAAINLINVSLAQGELTFIDRDQCGENRKGTDTRLNDLEDIETNRKGRMVIIGAGFAGLIILAQIVLPIVIKKFFG